MVRALLCPSSTGDWPNLFFLTMTEVKYDVRGDGKMENVGEMKIEKRKNPEKTSINPDIAHHNCLPGDIDSNLGSE